MSELWSKNENWIHFIGIGGIAIGQTALAVSKLGYQVTGSDGEIYEPMKSLLGKHSNIKVYNDYSFGNLIRKSGQANEIPFMVISQGGLSTNNKELLFARKRDIPVYHFAKFFAQKLIMPESIVVAGSFGKTTTTAMIIQIFLAAGKKISYMVGAEVKGLAEGVRLADQSTQYSIVEGDEYYAANYDKQSKFFYYNPKYLVLTGYSYDHTDFFLTPESYYENFVNLVKKIPQDGLVIYNSAYPELAKIVTNANCKTISYDQPKGKYNLQMIGDYNQENAEAASLMATNFGIDAQTIQDSLANFKGLKRRLDVIKETENLVIIDDFGSTPAKARASIVEVRKKYPTSRLIAIFEPNIGNRTEQSLASYRDTFNELDMLILPEFTKSVMVGLVSADELAEQVKQYRPQLIVKTLKSKYDLAAEIKPSNSEHTVILFLSSHSINDLLSSVLSI